MRHIEVEIELEAGGKLGILGDEDGIRVCVSTSDGDVEELLERCSDEDGEACVTLPRMNEAEVAWLSAKLTKWVEG